MVVVAAFSVGALAILTPKTLIGMRRETALDQPDLAGRYPYRTTVRRLGAVFIVAAVVLTYGLLIGGWWDR